MATRTEAFCRKLAYPLAPYTRIRTRRTTPTLLVLVLLAAVLFSRLALAFYACPAAPQTIATVAHMGGADCLQASSQSGMMDDAQPALCAQYFSGDQQITSVTAHAQAPELVLLSAYPLPSSSPTFVLSSGWHFVVPDGPPGPGGSGDTLYLQTFRLRI